MGMGKNLLTIRSRKLAADRLNAALRHVLFGPNSVFQTFEFAANLLKSGRFPIKKSRFLASFENTANLAALDLHVCLTRMWEGSEGCFF